ncbi:hypothetical protein RIEGSTA812A_PEG_771 [invertebrate metagenome]|uniref:Uncharacterized protein n=1 Tax=invertebrate metagenome TaxID=1711999 RepID=A0A484HAY1_9ZZZZ
MPHQLPWMVPKAVLTPAIGCNIENNKINNNIVFSKTLNLEDILSTRDRIILLSLC